MQTKRIPRWLVVLTALVAITVLLTACAETGPSVETTEATISQEFTVEQLNELVNEIAQTATYDKKEQCEVTVAVAAFKDVGSVEDLHIGYLKNGTFCCSRDIDLEKSHNSLGICYGGEPPSAITRVEIQVFTGGKDTLWSEKVFVWEE